MDNAEELLREANELLRSAHTIASREGENTNWLAFKDRVYEALVKQANTLGMIPTAPNVTVTPKVFKALPYL